MRKSNNEHATGETVDVHRSAEETQVMARSEYTRPGDRHLKGPLPHAEGFDCTLCRIYGYSDQWDDFDHAYIEFAMEYSQQMLTYTLDVELLSEFPKNLPEHILISIVPKRHQILAAEMRRRGICY